LKPTKVIPERVLPDVLPDVTTALARANTDITTLKDAYLNSEEYTAYAAVEQQARDHITSLETNKPKLAELNHKLEELNTKLAVIGPDDEPAKHILMKKAYEKLFVENYTIIPDIFIEITKLTPINYNAGDHKTTIEEIQKIMQEIIWYYNKFKENHGSKAGFSDLPDIKKDMEDLAKEWKDSFFRKDVVDKIEEDKNQILNFYGEVIIPTLLAPDTAITEAAVNAVKEELTKEIGKAQKEAADKDVLIEAQAKYIEKVEDAKLDIEAKYFQVTDVPYHLRVNARKVLESWILGNSEFVNANRNNFRKLYEHFLSKNPKTDLTFERFVKHFKVYFGM
jgi:hypothetical protein